MTISRSTLARTAPFAVFMAFLALRGMAPADGSWGFDVRWLYGAQALTVAALLAVWWRDYGELFRQNLPTARQAVGAVAVGLLVFAAWIRLDEPWMTIPGATAAPFLPVDASGRLEWPLIAVRWLGAVLVVPLMEELFWRSYLMRWLNSPRWEAVHPRQVGLKAIVLSTFVFTLAHPLWLAAALAGLAYALLYVRTGKLWVPVIAHAVTNAALGVWVVATGRWHFW